MMRPRILFVGNFLSAAGKTPQTCEELANHLEQAGSTVIRTSCRENRVVRFVDMLLFAWVRRSEYDVAHVDVFSGPSFLWAEAVTALLKGLGKTPVLTLHGGALPQFAGNRPRRIRRTFGWAGAVTTPSRYLLEHMQVYRDDIIVIPNAVEVARYPFRLRKPAEPKLVWLRAFDDIYNPTLAPRVLGRIRKRNPDATLVMVGPEKDGSLAGVKVAAEEEGVLDAIEFIGTVSRDRVPEILDRGDIFLNTTNIDNTPVSVIEAMACGLCVVSTNVGGIPHLLEHEHDALLVPPNDPNAMAAAVTRILNEPDLAAKLSTNARRKVEQSDWSIVLPQWEALFDEVVRSARFE